MTREALIEIIADCRARLLRGYSGAPMRYLPEHEDLWAQDIRDFIDFCLRCLPLAAEGYVNGRAGSDSLGNDRGREA
jgi:hypothetical protein